MASVPKAHVRANTDVQPLRRYRDQSLGDVYVDGQPSVSPTTWSLICATLENSGVPWNHCIVYFPRNQKPLYQCLSHCFIILRSLIVLPYVEISDQCILQGECSMQGPRFRLRLHNIRDRLLKIPMNDFVGQSERESKGHHNRHVCQSFAYTLSTVPSLCC